MAAPLHQKDNSKSLAYHLLVIPVIPIIQLIWMSCDHEFEQCLFAHRVHSDGPKNDLWGKEVKYFASLIKHWQFTDRQTARQRHAWLYERVVEWEVWGVEIWSMTVHGLGWLGLTQGVPSMKNKPFSLAAFLRGRTVWEALINVLMAIDTPTWISKMVK